MLLDQHSQEIEHKDDGNIKNRNDNSYIATFNNKIVTGWDIYNFYLVMT